LSVFLFGSEISSRPVLLSFGTRHGARFFLRSLRIYSSLSPVPRGQPRGPGRSVVLISGCWATVELIAALPEAYRRHHCLCGVFHVGHAWVSHRCVLSVCEVRSEAARDVAGHRLRASHVIASGVNVCCTVTDAVFNAVSLLFLFRRWNACNCLIVYCVLLCDVIAYMLGLVVTDCNHCLIVVSSRPAIF